jgi:hypothetical protein
MIVESRAHITATTVVLTRFLKDLLQEINEAESQLASAK